VIFDRRAAARARGAAAPPPAAERRRTSVDAELAALGWALVTRR